MPLRYRPMRPEDVPKGLHILAEHPILAPRFGQTINDLVEALAAVSGFDSVRGVTLEEIASNGQSNLLGVHIIGFVTDEFIARVKTAPYFWIGPEVTRLTSEGKTPFVDNATLRKANSMEGLNAITWLSLLALPARRLFEMQQLVIGPLDVVVSKAHVLFMTKESS